MGNKAAGLSVLSTYKPASWAASYMLIAFKMKFIVIHFIYLYINDVDKGTSWFHSVKNIFLVTSRITKHCFSMRTETGIFLTSNRHLKNVSEIL